MMEQVRVTVWNENVHDRSDDKVKEIYPEGLHGAIAQALRADEKQRFAVVTATLDQPEQGLPDDLLARTDVLFWWGHCAHNQVEDQLVERIYNRVMDGMGLVVLHSRPGLLVRPDGHADKIRLSVADGCKCVVQHRVALAQAFDLGAKQFEAALNHFEYMKLMSRLAVGNSGGVWFVL